MKEFKHLITSGCSFSDARTPYTWPLQLSSSYNISSYHTGLGSQGNGLIARKAIYAVHRALMQGISPKEILVGIMWSGPDRHDFYFSNLKDQLPEEVKEKDFMSINPTSYVNNDPGGWLIMNHHWNENKSKIYYSYLHDYVHQRINTYEKILWVQSHLKLLGVSYFMTAFTDEVFNNHDNFHDNPNITWMKDLIDWSHWLPVKSMHEWCYQHWTINDFPTHRFQDKTTGEWREWPDNHPTEIMHKRFVKDVVLPFINERFPDYHCPEFKEYIHV